MCTHDFHFVGGEEHFFVRSFTGEFRESIRVSYVSLTRVTVRLIVKDTWNDSYAVIFRTLSCPSESSSCLDVFSASNTRRPRSGPLWLITATAKGLTPRRHLHASLTVLHRQVVHLYLPLTIALSENDTIKIKWKPACMRKVDMAGMWKF